ncbi:hypothetical protein, partial [Streptococcus pseudopneumoniae]|uniref:hypothetical protein n=1 Tax=Streptococcus pseudopneumoniae TaxID=257758 RepID=UPI0019D5F31C
ADPIFKVVPTPAKSVRSIRDGDGPPDESWLRSVGFVTAENQYWVWASNKSSGVSLACNTNQGSFHAGDFVISELRSGKEMPKSVRVA